MSIYEEGCSLNDECYLTVYGTWESCLKIIRELSIKIQFFTTLLNYHIVCLSCFNKIKKMFSKEILKFNMHEARRKK